MEMIGRRLEAELELFIMDCHALSKDGIISKSEEIVMKERFTKVSDAAETGAGSVPDFVVYRTHFGKCVPLYTGSKRRGRALGIGSEKMDVGH